MTVVSMPRVTAPLAPPPVMQPVPVTPVMSPVPTESAEHATVPSALTPVMKLPSVQVPVTRLWMTVVLTASETPPLTPPPVRPAPGVTPVMSPVPISATQLTVPLALTPVT